MLCSSSPVFTHKVLSLIVLIEMVIFHLSVLILFILFALLILSMVDWELLSNFIYFYKQRCNTLLHDPVHIHQSFCCIYTQKWNYWET